MAAFATGVGQPSISLAIFPQKVAKNLSEQGVKDSNLENREIVALIAYLQRLGTDIKTTK